MTTIQQLEDAIRERIAKENTFKDSIISHINGIVSRLPMCDASNATPEVSDTVNLSKAKLTSILQKIGDYSSINEKAAKDLIAKLNLRNLRKPRTPRRSSSLGDIDNFMLEHPDSKDYFSDPSNVENAFRLEASRVNPRGVPYANYNGRVTGTDEETHFGGRRTRRR